MASAHGRGKKEMASANRRGEKEITRKGTGFEAR